MPWQERPEGCKSVLWRYSANPVIPRDLLPDSNSIDHNFWKVIHRVSVPMKQTTEVNASTGLLKDIKTGISIPETVKLKAESSKYGKWYMALTPHIKMKQLLCWT